MTCLLLGAALPAQAASQKQSAIPIQIQSNNAEFDQKSDQSIYSGNVQMTRAGLTLTGNKLVITRLEGNNHIQAVLTGSPAHIEKKPDSDGDQYVTGHAHSITYVNGRARITLSGNAVVTRDGDQIKASVITYNPDTGTTHAESKGSSDNRVHITISPKNLDQD